MMAVICQQREYEVRAAMMGRRCTNPRQDDVAARAGFVALRIQVLGGFRVTVGARVVADDDWRLLKARALVKILALDPGHRLARDEVMEALWPEADAGAARRNLTYALHVARRVLDRDEDGAAIRSSLLQLDQGFLSFHAPGGLHIDAGEFAAAAQSS